MTLREISERFSGGISAEELRNRLEAHGVSVISLDQTLEDIAGKNRISAKEVYDLLGVAGSPKTGRGGGGGRRNQ